MKQIFTFFKLKFFSFPFSFSQRLGMNIKCPNVGFLKSITSGLYVYQFCYNNTFKKHIPLSDTLYVEILSYFYIEKLTFKVMCEIRKKQHDFKSVHFECRMVLFTRYVEKYFFFWFFESNFQNFHNCGNSGHSTRTPSPYFTFEVILCMRDP